MGMIRQIVFYIALLAPIGASAASISFVPEKPIQGEPVLISVDATSTVSTIYFDGKRLGVFLRDGKPSALYGVDLYKKPGTYKAFVALSSGETIQREVSILARVKEEAPLGIPEKLGGNSTSSATTLVSTLAKENAGLLGLRTGTHAFWKEKFRYPVENATVTDGYGYLRQTVGYSIAHKGTDFRAQEGTPVLAMNRGVVRLAQTGRNYGKTIIVDHGLGIQTLYMHLSKIYVNVGELVKPGQVIGLSGKTGYAESPHLHLSIRINETSIDPMRFLEIFK